MTLEMLHVSVGYVLGAQVAQALRRAPGRSLKLDMFWWVVGLKVLVSRFMYHDTWFSIGGNECRAAIET